MLGDSWCPATGNGVASRRRASSCRLDQGMDRIARHATGGGGAAVRCVYEVVTAPESLPKVVCVLLLNPTLRSAAGAALLRR